MSRLACEIGGLSCPSPILPASGTFGLAHGRVFDLSRLGAVVPKTITLHPREGHRAPRLVARAGGLINAIGIPSPGIEAFVERDVPHYAALGPPLLVSVSGDTVEEFCALAERLAQEPRVAGVELNLSCPNLEAGGTLFAALPQSASEVVSACRALYQRPLWCKLTPAAGAPSEVARACADAGADALVLTNTMPALALAADGAQLLANRVGGLSGAPLKPIALRILDEVARAVSLPLIGCGGVFTLADVLEYRAAGASAVAVGSATLERPAAMARLIDALDAHLAETGRTASDPFGARGSVPHGPSVSALSVASQRQGGDP